jgi:hypothetical protein
METILRPFSARYDTNDAVMQAPGAIRKGIDRIAMAPGPRPARFDRRDCGAPGYAYHSARVSGSPLRPSACRRTSSA